MTTKAQQAEAHEAVLERVGREMASVLEGSAQAVYVYACDNHKLCNRRFASMLGYGTPEEWASTNLPFVDTFVAQESQDAMVGAYWTAMTEKVGSKVPINWRRKEGGEVATDVIVVPITLDGQDLALHFVSMRRK
jgi:PAS domain-containing protein